MAVSGEETGDDHDQVGGDGHEDVATVKTGEKAKVEQKERSGERPVDVTSPVDLAVDILGGVGNVLVLLADLDVVVVDTHASGHTEVGDGGNDGDEAGDDMVETAALYSVRCLFTILTVICLDLRWGWSRTWQRRQQRRSP